MNAVRYYVALLLTVCLPPLLLYWLLVHSLVRMWRRLGPALTLALLWILIGLGAAGLFLERERLLTTDYGTNWFAGTAGLACLVGAAWLRRRLHRHFGVQTLLGLPELAPDRYPQRLVTEGLHARVRHPRYLQLLLALLGWALVANHLAAYVAWALWIPGVWVIVRLEEKELRARFGVAYEEYCRRVPRFIPC